MAQKDKSGNTGTVLNKKKKTKTTAVEKNKQSIIGMLREGPVAKMQKDKN